VVSAADDSWSDLLLRVGGNIIRRRNAARLTQAGLAEKLDVAEEHLRRVEGGKRAPSLQLLHRCANEFGVDVLDLFEDRPAPARNPGRPRRRG